MILLCLVALSFGRCHMFGCDSLGTGLMEMGQMLLSLKDMTAGCPVLCRLSLGEPGCLREAVDP